MMMLGAYAGRICKSHLREADARTDVTNERTRTETSLTLHIDHSVSQRARGKANDEQVGEKPVDKAKLWVWLTRKAETMTPQEASDLLDLADSIWANVKNTPRTCEAWFLALAHTNFYDAKDAIGSLARERKTVHVSDIVKRAASVRESLLRSLPPIPDPPVELADDLAAEVQWLRTARERQLHKARLERHAVAV